MALQDLLSEDEIKKYQEQWGLFTGKYKLETPYNVHSGLPIIGQVFQFENKPLFRAHIFKRRLKKAFDPYFVSGDGYLHPHFHLTHYFFPIEQIAHASLGRIIPNYEHYVITDRFDTKKPPVMKGKIDFKETRASIELIPHLTLGRDRFVVRGSATFYEDRTNEPLQIWYLEGFGELREYVKNIHRLRGGDSSATGDLMREIEAVNLKHQRMCNPRKYTSKNELIERIKSGEIPEIELHDFFSYWDTK
jgi:hypothetical protein